MSISSPHPYSTISGLPQKELVAQHICPIRAKKLLLKIHLFKLTVITTSPSLNHRDYKRIESDSREKLLDKLNKSNGANLGPGCRPIETHCFCSFLPVLWPWYAQIYTIMGIYFSSLLYFFFGETARFPYKYSCFWRIGFP